MEAFKEKKVLTSLNVCFSRDGVSGPKYVMDLMKRDVDRERIKRLLLAEDGILFVCGDGNRMAKDVCACVEDILGGGEEGKRQVEGLKARGKIILDVWV